MKKPRIVLVTDESPHHYYWIHQLMEELDVVGVFFPKGKKEEKGLFKMIKKKKMFLYGSFWFLLKILSLAYHKFSKASFSKDLSRKEASYYGDFKKNPPQQLKVLAHRVGTINSPDSIEKLKAMQPDFLCFLGGDIARKEAIDCASTATLNYHSGLSPIYNGTKTVFQAVSDQRPNLAGGTLMYMNERIDGGKILSHYLPAIEEKDTAADLFLKGIDGAAKAYISFFKHIETKPLPEGVQQGRSLKFLRNIDWTILNDMKLNWIGQNGIMKRYRRAEHLMEHFDLKTDDADEVMKRLSRSTLYK